MCHSKVNSPFNHPRFLLVITLTLSQPIRDKKSFGFSWRNGKLEVVTHFTAADLLWLISTDKEIEILSDTRLGESARQWNPSSKQSWMTCADTRAQGQGLAAWQQSLKKRKKKRKTEPEPLAHRNWTQGNLALAPGLGGNYLSSPRSITAPLSEGWGVQEHYQKGRELSRSMKGSLGVAFDVFPGWAWGPGLWQNKHVSDLCLPTCEDTSNMAHPRVYLHKAP